MVEQDDVSRQQATPRRRSDPLAGLRACRRGEHRPTPALTIDIDGLQYSRCRTCGCDLARMPVLRRWFRTGQMG